jgi:hypothetical protein
MFSAWQLYALLHGASSLLVIFLFFELAWGVVQVLPVDKTVTWPLRQEI